jgi:hypothetical protein
MLVFDGPSHHFYLQMEHSMSSDSGGCVISPWFSFPLEFLAFSLLRCFPLASFMYILFYLSDAISLHLFHSHASASSRLVSQTRMDLISSPFPIQIELSTSSSTTHDIFFVSFRRGPASCWDVELQCMLLLANKFNSHSPSPGKMPNWARQMLHRQDLEKRGNKQKIEGRISQVNALLQGLCRWMGSTER